MQKILGLDIGTYSIKVVIIWNDYKNYYIPMLVEQIIEYKEGVNEKDSQIAALENLFQQKQLEFDLVYAAVDSKKASIRKVDFENIRKRDIPGFLENELESSSPFTIDESVLDFQVIEYSKSRSSVLAVLCKKEIIRNTLDVIEHQNLRVKILDIDNLAYLNLVSYLLKKDTPIIEKSGEDNLNSSTVRQNNNCNLIINIGHSKTSLTFMTDKKVLFTRIISLAGDHFNQVLKNKFEISYAEADILKCFVSSIVVDNEEDINSKKNIVIKTLFQAVFELGQEIIRSIQFFQSQEKIKIKGIYLTGGSSKIKGIYKYFEEILNTQVSSIFLKKENFLFVDEKYLKNEEASMAVYSQVLAISMRGLQINGTTSKLNLRKGEFAQISNYNKLIHQIFLYSGYTSAVILLLLISYFFRSITYSREINSLKNSFRKDVISMFSGEPSPLRLISNKKDWDFNDYSNEAISLIKQSLKDKKDLLENYSSTEIPFSLKIIDEVSKTIPKEIVFEVSEIRIQDKQLYIEADTNNPDNIPIIIKYLDKIKNIHDVMKKSQSFKLDSNNKITHFSLVASFVEEEI